MLASVTRGILGITRPPDGPTIRRPRAGAKCAARALTFRPSLHSFTSMPETVRNNVTAFPKAWPFEEAAKVARRLETSGRREALFETGYGPSGLPHTRTFGDVARTSWVRHAFTVMTGLPSKLLAFSDDMDGLRKVPDNVPNKDMLQHHLGQPL